MDAKDILGGLGPAEGLALPCHRHRAGPNWPDVMRRHQRDAYYGLLMGATAAGDHRARP
jgi:hypothetical protein